MSKQLVVVEDAKDLKVDFPDMTVVEAEDYLADPEFLQLRNVQVINMCRSYRYQTVGYYCSLLAEARKHKVVPTVGTILDLSRRAIYGLQVEDIEEVVGKTLQKQELQGRDEFILDVFFGKCAYPNMANLAHQIFELFPCPLMQVSFEKQGAWRINSIRALALNKLTCEQKGLFSEALGWYRKKKWRSPKSRTQSRYDLAVLVDPEEKLPPSDKRALTNFVNAGKSQGVAVDLITRKDYSRLAEYDALFIRATTGINHYTFRFAKKAEVEGMPVLDDPTSIRRCTNKVYLSELLSANRIQAPTSKILYKHEEKNVAVIVERVFDYPVVLKVPDGSFSSGVHKANNRQELLDITAKMFHDSELILAQEFIYTDFDWRIGVLNRTPIFACQYFMSRRHWQIVKYGPSGRFTQGGSKSWALGEVPQGVISIAVNAANLIGDGLYGVDIKQHEDRYYVIEVNDNPSIEAGVEDAHLKGELYNVVIRDFVRRLDSRRTT